jgi:hypothetical protein
LPILIGRSSPLGAKFCPHSGQNFSVPEGSL